MCKRRFGPFVACFVVIIIIIIIIIIVQQKLSDLAKPIFKIW